MYLPSVLNIWSFLAHPGGSVTVIRCAEGCDRRQIWGRFTFKAKVRLSYIRIDEAVKTNLLRLQIELGVGTPKYIRPLTVVLTRSA